MRCRRLPPNSLSHGYYLGMTAPQKPGANPEPADPTLKQTVAEWRSPWWVDAIFIVAIVGLAVFVSIAVGEVHGRAAGVGILFTSWGLALSLASRHWTFLKRTTYYAGLVLGLGGLVAAMLSL